MIKISRSRRHSNAAGVSIQESNLEKLITYANEHISEEGLKNCYTVDYIFQPDEDITGFIYTFVQNSFLWGNDIEEPEIVVESIPFTKDKWFLMGEQLDCAKLVYKGVEYIRFKDEKFAWECQEFERGTITVYGTVALNNYKGKRTPQIIIRDYEIKDTTFEF